jgi:hypothetical protein
VQVDPMPCVDPDANRLRLTFLQAIADVIVFDGAAVRNLCTRCRVDLESKVRLMGGPQQLTDPVPLVMRRAAGDAS